MAYVFISIVEVFLVSITPVVISSGIPQMYIAGAVQLAIFAALMIMTIIKYGVQRYKDNELRPGEAEIIEEYMKEKQMA